MLSAKDRQKLDNMIKKSKMAKRLPDVRKKLVVLKANMGRYLKQLEQEEQDSSDWTDSKKREQAYRYRVTKYAQEDLEDRIAELDADVEEGKNLTNTSGVILDALERIRLYVNLRSRIHKMALKDEQVKREMRQEERQKDKEQREKTNEEIVRHLQSQAKAEARKAMQAVKMAGFGLAEVPVLVIKARQQHKLYRQASRDKLLKLIGERLFEEAYTYPDTHHLVLANQKVLFLDKEQDKRYGREMLEEAQAQLARIGYPLSKIDPIQYGKRVRIKGEEEVVPIPVAGTYRFWILYKGQRKELEELVGKISEWSVME